MIYTHFPMKVGAFMNYQQNKVLERGAFNDNFLSSSLVNS